MDDFHPCRQCGACCAYFRISFHWLETTESGGPGVPVELTEPITPHLRAMKGTNSSRPHCIALEGQIGAQAACRIYCNRPLSCALFEPSWEKGEPNERCDRARLAYNLPPLGPENWGPVEHPEQPRAA